MWGDTHPLERAARFAIGYEPPSIHPPQFELPRFDEIIRDVFSNKIVPFFLWAIKIFFAVSALFFLSVGSYAILYWGVIMRGLEVKSHPIFFDYSPGDAPMPIGRVDLQSSRRSPWVYIDAKNGIQNVIHTAPGVDANNTNKKMSSDSIEENLACEDGRDPTKNENTDEGNLQDSSILIPRRKYFFEVVLDIPESQINKELGVFMVTVHLQSDEVILATSKQASMLPYESSIVSIFRKLSLMIPLASGLLSETKTISLLCFDNYVDLDKNHPLSNVEIRLDIPHPASFPATSQTIQIQSSELRYGKEMNSLQLFFRNWRYLCGFSGVTMFFFWYSFLVLLFLHHRVKRRWSSNQSQQPYGDLFDSIDGSALGSKSGSWMGGDIEFLDDDNDSDAWEPIGSAKTNSKSEKGTAAIDTSNIISDEESIDSDTNTRGSSKRKQNTCNKKSEFPLGTIENNPSVEGHKPMFSSPNTTNQDQKANKTKEEEKCLADLVMKGYTKWEIFTDHDDPDNATSSSDGQQSRQEI